MSVKVLDSIWFSCMQVGRPIGIVLVQNEVNETKAFIGFGAGDSEDYDASVIAKLGGPFPIEAAAVLFPLLGKK